MEQIKRKSIFAHWIDALVKSSIFGNNEHYTENENLNNLSDVEKQTVSPKVMEELKMVQDNSDREKNAVSGFNSNAGSTGGTSNIKTNPETEAAMRKKRDEFVAKQQETKKTVKTPKTTTESRKKSDDGMEIGG